MRGCSTSAAFEDRREVGVGPVTTAKNGAISDRPNGDISFSDSSISDRISYEMSSVPVYTFELPTTGSLSFVDYFSDGSEVYTYQISNVTQARANLRAVLKESKHGDGDKDYLRLVKARLIPRNMIKPNLIIRLVDNRGVPTPSLCRCQVCGLWRSHADSRSR
jgi:hypothetical protein